MSLEPEQWIAVSVRRAGPAWNDRWMVATPDCYPGLFDTRSEACQWLAGYFMRHGQGVPIPEASSRD